MTPPPRDACKTRFDKTSVETKGVQIHGVRRKTVKKSLSTWYRRTMLCAIEKSVMTVSGMRNNFVIGRKRPSPDNLQSSDKLNPTTEGFEDGNLGPIYYRTVSGPGPSFGVYSSLLCSITVFESLKGEVVYPYSHDPETIISRDTNIFVFRVLWIGSGGGFLVSKLFLYI